MKPIADDLHQIISRLTAEQKRLFKQQLTADKKQTQASQIFDLLAGMKTFHATAYESYIGRKKMQSTAASVKSQLKERLIDWLAANSQAPSGTNWFKAIATGEILMEYELYDDARSQFEKVRKETFEQGLGMYEYTALTYLSNLAQTLPPQQVMKTMIELSNRITEIGHKTYNMARALNFYIRTITIYYECRSTNKATHQAMVEQMSREHFFSDSDEYVPMEQAIYIFYARSLIYQMLGKLQQAHAENNKLYKRILEFEAKFKTHQPHEYAIAFREKLYNCLLAEKLTEYQEIYEELYHKTTSAIHVPGNYELRLKAIHLLYLIKCNNTGLLNAELEAMEQHKKSTQYKIQTTANKKEALMYQGYGYMHIHDLENAINIFETLLQMKVKEVGNDYDNSARFMLLLCLFAAEILQHRKLIEEPSAYLDNQSKALYEFYIKNRIEAPVEKNCIKFFQDIAKGGLKAVQKDKALLFLKKIKKELNEPRPYYRLQFAEFNWPEWMKEILEHN